MKVILNNARNITSCFDKDMVIVRNHASDSSKLRVRRASVLPVVARANAGQVL